MKITIRLDTFIERLPIYFIFFFSIDTVLFGTNNNASMKWISRGVTVLTILVLIISSVIRKKSVHFNKRMFTAFLVMSFIMILSGILNGDGVEVYLSRYLFFATGFVIANHYDLKTIAKAFIGFVYFLSIAALVMEVIAVVLPGAIRLLPSIVNTAGRVFNTAFISSVEQRYLGTGIIRSSSIFWEPGAYSVYLSFAMSLELFLLKTPRFRYVFVFLAAISLTFSTTGYLSVAVIMLAYVISHRDTMAEKNVRIAFIILLVFLFIMVFALENSYLRTIVFDKLTNESSSASTRYSSLFNGMAVAFEHPLLGVSGQTQFFMAKHVNAAGNPFSIGGVSITNTIVGQFASEGLLFGSLFLFGTVAFAKHISKNWKEWLLITLALAIAYSGERFFSMFPFLWMFYGIGESGFRHEEEEDFSVRLEPQAAAAD